jgi:hypothetical protein
LSHPAEGFASTITAFCDRLGYCEIHAAIRSFTKRVVKAKAEGRQVQQQQTGLADIKGLEGPRLRLLFEGGVQTPEQLAAAEVEW